MRINNYQIGILTKLLDRKIKIHTKNFKLKTEER